MQLTWDEWCALIDQFPREDRYTPLYLHIMDHIWNCDGSCAERVFDIPMTPAYGRLYRPIMRDMQARAQFQQDRRRFPRHHWAMVKLVNPSEHKQHLKRYRKHRRRFRERMSETG